MLESVEEKIDQWTSEKTYPEQWDWSHFKAWMARSFGIDFEAPSGEILDSLNQDRLKEILLEQIKKAYDDRKEKLGSEILSQIERMVLLQMIDTAWRDNLYELDQLKKGIYFRAYAHKDPKIEYQKESFALFDGMMRRIRETTIEYVFRVQVNVMPKSMLNDNIKTTKPDINEKDSDKTYKKSSSSVNNHRDLKKIGRNDPCPCGSGKKYKKCCGKNI